MKIIQRCSDLPDFSEAKKLYIDFETTSFNSETKAVYPYLGTRIAGIACTVDNDPVAYYIPIRHTRVGNIPETENILQWLRDVLKGERDWINHNIKFDAHCATVDGIPIELNNPLRLIDTLTLAKLINSDRWSHNLKPLCRDWLKLPMEEELEVDAYLKGIKSKNYGDVPVDILGKYAGMDVLANRELYKYLCRECPEQVKRVWDTEIKLTPVLYDMERRGLLVDPFEIKIERAKALAKIIHCDEQLKKLIGTEYTDSAKFNRELLIDRFNLPVLAWTNQDNKNKDKQSNPSFDKHAMALYAIHPQVLANATLKRIVDLIIDRRNESYFENSFLSKYDMLQDSNHRIHCSFKQAVRTGRMSTSEPNFQGVSPRARALIHPGNKTAFLSADASQIEFRLIIHYCKDEETIKAYWQDKELDIHQWVADQIGIKRKPAKNVNFAIGYGAGKAKVTKMLSGNPDIMKEVGEIINEKAHSFTTDTERDFAFRRECYARAVNIYEAYHSRFPGIKNISRQAAINCRRRGFVFNGCGRRRHLPVKASNIAFNAAVQSFAMDLIKERMVALAQRYNTRIRNSGLHLLHNVHDEILFDGPQEAIEDKELQKYINNTLEQNDVDLRVPIYWDMRTSTKDWCKAAGKDE